MAQFHQQTPGSIPAHAGEPRRRAMRWRREEVYPRPRGGTRPPRVAGRGARGLSPPTRGNQHTSLPDAPCAGSIPAHAGEPAAPSLSPRPSPVYPRPRGGTEENRVALLGGGGLSPPTRGNQRAYNPARMWRGLSPPTRGNRYRPRRPASIVRSIPAHAGEPRTLSWSSAPTWVYPRPRGGTDGNFRIARKLEGLSPPTRGNRMTSKRRNIT